MACVPVFFVLVEQGWAVNGFNEYYAAYRMCNIRFGGACSPHDEKYMGLCKKYKPCILKYKAFVSKYMPCIFHCYKPLNHNNLQEGVKNEVKSVIYSGIWI
ncbi:MAG: hypothetical protein DBY24_03220 [Prevotellaceae bacterium]|nr:MAG: hypothetical protein DBY24_03220 [Prevotellaceae bacterium]